MESEPFKNKFVLLGVLFLMVLSSGVLISNFGNIGNKSLSASAIQPIVQNAPQNISNVDTVINVFGSSYLALGNTIIDTTNIIINGYGVGIQAWVNTMPRVASVSTNTVVAVGSSIEKMAGTTATVVPTIYINGIYTVGNGIAYLGIKSSSANSLASAWVGGLFTGNNYKR